MGYREHNEVAEQLATAQAARNPRLAREPAASERDYLAHDAERRAWDALVGEHEDAQWDYLAWWGEVHDQRGLVPRDRDDDSWFGSCDGDNTRQCMLEGGCDRHMH